MELGRRSRKARTAAREGVLQQRALLPPTHAYCVSLYDSGQPACAKHEHAEARLKQYLLITTVSTSLASCIGARSEPDDRVKLCTGAKRRANLHVVPLAILYGLRIWVEAQPERQPPALLIPCAQPNCSQPGCPVPYVPTCLSDSLLRQLLRCLAHSAGRALLVALNGTSVSP